MSNTLTRTQIAFKLNTSLTTVESWCRGYHDSQGKHQYFFPDQHGITPVSGSGKKGDPFRYNLSDVKTYLKDIRKKRSPSIYR